MEVDDVEVERLVEVELVEIDVLVLDVDVLREVDVELVDIDVEVL